MHQRCNQRNGLMLDNKHFSKFLSQITNKCCLRQLKASRVKKWKIMQKTESMATTTKSIANDCQTFWNMFGTDMKHSNKRKKQQWVKKKWQFERSHAAGYLFKPFSHYLCNHISFLNLRCVSVQLMPYKNTPNR